MLFLSESCEHTWRQTHSFREPPIYVWPSLPGDLPEPNLFTHTQDTLPSLILFWSKSHKSHHFLYKYFSVFLYKRTYCIFNKQDKPFAHPSRPGGRRTMWQVRSCLGDLGSPWGIQSPPTSWAADLQTWTRHGTENDATCNRLWAARASLSELGGASQPAMFPAGLY